MLTAVTGGAGFIGTELCRDLVMKGHQVVSIDRVTNPELPAAVFQKEADVLDPIDLLHAAEAADVIVHLAGPVVDAVRRDPAASVDLQIRGTTNVLEVARRIEAKRVILASSFYVYSGMPSEAVVNEVTPLNVHDADLFGAVKLMAERLVRQWGDRYGIPWVALRFGSVYGWGNCTNVVKSIIESGLKGEEFEVWGKGLRRNQYTLVDDVVRGIVAAIDSPAATNRVFNLISPEVTTVGELAEVLSEHGFRTRFDTERADPPSMCQMTSYAAQTELEWVPTPLDIGVSGVVAAARRSQDRVQVTHTQGADHVTVTPLP